MNNNRMNEKSKPIKVLIVEDSPVVQELLAHILNSDAEINVIGTAGNGSEALEFLKYKRPDVILMDVNMPKMNGYEATRRIMETRPVPTIIVSSSLNPKEVENTFHAIEAGAVAALEKPEGVWGASFMEASKKLTATVKAMSEVKLVRRMPEKRWAEIPETLPDVDLTQRQGDIKVIAIGASTGGPPVLQTILSMLPGDLSVPVLIVQHIAKGFMPGLVNWLGQTTGFPVKTGSHGEYALPGHAYIAPDSFHMGVDKGCRIILSNDDTLNGLCPSVSYLFRSVANSFGQRAIGVLLTGMGRDGAEELKMMKERGAVTIAQDKESSVVYGMPGEAVNIDAAAYVLQPERIGAMIKSLVRKDLTDVEKNPEKS